MIRQLLNNLMVGDETNCNFEEDLDNFHSFVVETFRGCKDQEISPKNNIECIGDLFEFSNSNLNLPSFDNDIDIIKNQGPEMTSNLHITDKKPLYTQNFRIHKPKRLQMEKIDQQTKVCQDENLHCKCEAIMAKNRLDGILEDNNIAITEIHWLDSLKKE